MNNNKCIYFDCRTGVSGDMVLGSLVDLGADVHQLEQELIKLNLGEFHLEARKQEHYGVQGTNLFILKEGHDHHHHHHGHSHRSYKEIEKIILEADLKEAIKKRGISIYRAIAAAEAEVHETDMEQVHFHEVGRDIAIMNIVGTAICLDFLGVDQFTCSELRDGTGFITCSHGEIPVPVPAVKALLKGTTFKLVQENTPGEMVTPSGLGILKGIQARYVPVMPGIPGLTGVGLGKNELGKFSGLTAYLLDKSIK